MIPTLTIIHSLPGRVRLHFSIPPANPLIIKEQLLKDNRIRKFEYSRVSRTCVIRFDHKAIEFLHILKILAIALADEYHRQPIYVRPKDIHRFTLLAKLSATTILAAGVNRLFQVKTLTNLILGWAAVLTTAAAVVEHAYIEIEQNGTFDPEALSVVYLINSAGQNQLLRGASFTWLASFSRHLLRLPYMDGLKLTVIEGFDAANQKRYLDVVAGGSISMSSLEGR